MKTNMAPAKLSRSRYLFKSISDRYESPAKLAALKMWIARIPIARLCVDSTVIIDNLSGGKAHQMHCLIMAADAERGCLHKQLPLYLITSDVRAARWPTVGFKVSAAEFHGMNGQPHANV